MLGQFKRRYWALVSRLNPKPPPEKHAGEMEYWIRQCEAEGGKLQNGWYKRLMLAMAGEVDDGFLAGKIVADFGCGPRGTLSWAAAAEERVGIDVLAEAYVSRFDTSQHRMRYVASTEESIPLDDASVDVIYTLNALDHVSNLDAMCDELLRILRPEGELIGSFNLNEPPTPTEPQTLTEEMLDQALLGKLDVRFRQVSPWGPKGQRYVHCFNKVVASAGEKSFLWVRARKPMGPIS